MMTQLVSKHPVGMSDTDHLGNVPVAAAQSATKGQTAESISMRSARFRRRVSGLEVTAVDFHNALAILQAASGRNRDAAPLTVAFLNAHNANVARNDASYRQSLAAADLVLPDGIGFRMTALLQGCGLLSNIPGTDLIPALLRCIDVRGTDVFLLGHEPDGIERVALNFEAMFPAVRLAGFHHGYFPREADASIVERINASGAQVLLVGIGTPKQEKWLLEHSTQLSPRLQICVGGLFQYWEGALRRAPPVVRKLGLEWLWILCQQPHKWRRYLIGNTSFVLRALTGTRPHCPGK